MDKQTYLLTLAQIGVAVAGITGLLFVLRPSSKRLTGGERRGLYLLLEFAFAVVFFAFCPYLLSFLIIRDAWLWRISSLLLGIFFVLELINQAHRISIARSQHTQSAMPRLRNLLYFFFFPTGIFFAGDLMLNVIWGTFGIYAWALFLVLVDSGIQFFIFIYLLEQAESSQFDQ